MIIFQRVPPGVKAGFAKFFKVVMSTLLIVANIGVPAYIIFYSYEAFTTGHTRAGFLFAGIAYLLVVNSVYERVFRRGTKEFEEGKQWLTDRQKLLSLCNNQRFDDLNKTVEALKEEVKRLKKEATPEETKGKNTLKDIDKRDQELVESHRKDIAECVNRSRGRR